MAINVKPTYAKYENLSRTDMLLWVNDFLQTKFTKVGQLCTGSAYCQFMNILFPGSLSMKKVNFHAYSKYAYAQNFKILQASFKKKGVNEVIPIEKLITGRFKDNFEFLLWFKKFFDLNYKDTANSVTSFGRGSGDNHGTGDKRPRISTYRKTSAMVTFIKIGRSTPANIISRTSSVYGTFTSRPKVLPRVAAAMKNANNNNKANDVLKQQIDKLSNQIKDMRLHLEDSKKERDFYFSKILDLEILCDKYDKEESNPFIQEMLQILYGK